MQMLFYDFDVLSLVATAESFKINQLDADDLPWNAAIGMVMKYRAYQKRLKQEVAHIHTF